MRAARPLVLVAATAVAAVLLSGCLWLKPGSVTLTQPSGIGPVHLRFVVCTQIVQGEGENAEAVCGAGSSSTQGQFFFGLMVPTGTQAPETITAAPGPGAGPMTFTRNAEVAQGLIASAAEGGTSLPAPGSEILGYGSNAISEPSGQTLEWTVDAELGLPPVADGGSYGGPFSATVMPATREVSTELPATRPFKCNVNLKSDLTPCTTTEPAVQLGTSDLKISAPASTAVAPGTKVKIPFSLDFASTATALPKFSLRASSSLKKAALSLSSGSFSRAPTNATTHRAPATVRKATVEVPPAAVPGAYEVTLTATAAQGGTATGVAKLTVKPPLRARLRAPKRVTAQIAAGKGIPVRVTMPVAGSRLVLSLLAPKPNGHGKTQLKKIARKAKKAAGPLNLRLKIPATKTAALLAADAKLNLLAKIVTPGKKPQKLTRSLRLR